MKLGGEGQRWEGKKKTTRKNQFSFEENTFSPVHVTEDHMVDRSAKLLYKTVTRKILGGQKNALLMVKTESHTEHGRMKKRKVKKGKNVKLAKTF